MLKLNGLIAVLVCSIFLSHSTPVSAQAFIRGYVNSDDQVDLADAIFILTYYFAGGPQPACMKAADVNDSEQVDLADAIYILTYYFSGGSDPKPPFPGCGADPTYPGTLSCVSFEQCAGFGCRNDNC